MINKFIVYETVFKDRWTSGLVVSESEKFVTVAREARDPGDAPESRRLKKSAIGSMGLFDTAEDAVRAATSLSDALNVLNEEHRRQHDALVSRYLSLKVVATRR